MVNPTSDHDADFEPVERMELIAGNVALDFVNTASGRSVGPLREKLESYGDLVTWAERVGILDARLGRLLRKSAAAHPRKAEALLMRARDLREAMYRLFVSRSVRPEDLELVSEEAALAAAQRSLASEPEGYRFTWRESDEVDRVLWPVAWQAAELLSSPDRDRVGECAADNCNWLFLDMSRNRSRRWCDMKVCGNRAKARRFSARHP